MKTVSKIILCTLGLVACFLGFTYYGHKTHLDATGLPDGMTLTEFLKKRPYHAINSFTADGKTYIFIQGLFASGDWGLPSGPPAYIFDDTGKLVDWTDDNNEGRRMSGKWGGDYKTGYLPPNAVGISSEKAEQIVTSH